MERIPKITRNPNTTTHIGALSSLGKTKVVTFHINGLLLFNGFLAPQTIKIDYYLLHLKNHF
jgi:hypothetical protein